MKPLFNFQNISFNFTFLSKTSGMKPLMLYSTTTIAVLVWVIFIHQRETPGQPTTSTAETFTTPQQTAAVVLHGPGLNYLPDGSTVMLDEHTELTYNNTTYDMLREVTLEGQAYFDVKHNANNIFRVHTNNVTTTVLGTAFNIKALPDQPLVKITVAHGKVEVGNKTTAYDILTTHEQITIYNFTQKFVKTHVKIDTVISWRNKYNIIIDDKPLTEVKSLIEEAYHVQIVLANEKLKSTIVSGGIQKGQRLTDVLDIITLLIDASYTIEGKKVVISSNE